MSEKTPTEVDKLNSGIVSPEPGDSKHNPGFVNSEPGDSKSKVVSLVVDNSTSQDEDDNEPVSTSFLVQFLLTELLPTLPEEQETLVGIAVQRLLSQERRIENLEGYVEGLLDGRGL